MMPRPTAEEACPQGLATVHLMRETFRLLTWLPKVVGVKMGHHPGGPARTTCFSITRRLSWDGYPGAIGLLPSPVSWLESSCKPLR
jgi:hypothetical protein